MVARHLTRFFLDAVDAICNLLRSVTDFTKFSYFILSWTRACGLVVSLVSFLVGCFMNYAVFHHYIYASCVKMACCSYYCRCRQASVFCYQFSPQPWCHYGVIPHYPCCLCNPIVDVYTSLKGVVWVGIGFLVQIIAVLCITCSSLRRRNRTKLDLRS